jgi:predicted nucleotidyltransferase
MTRARIKLDPEQIEAFCRRHGIGKLSLFGSVLRDDFDDESDVDVLVELEPGVRLGLMALVGIEEELSEIVGRKVDLRKPVELSPYFRDRVLAEAEVQYVRRR